MKLLRGVSVQVNVETSRGHGPYFTQMVSAVSGALACAADRAEQDKVMATSMARRIAVPLLRQGGGKPRCDVISVCDLLQSALNAFDELVGAVEEVDSYLWMLLK